MYIYAKEGVKKRILTLPPPLNFMTTPFPKHTKWKYLLIWNIPIHPTIRSLTPSLKANNTSINYCK